LATLAAAALSIIAVPVIGLAASWSFTHHGGWPGLILATLGAIAAFVVATAMYWQASKREFLKIAQMRATPGACLVDRGPARLRVTLGSRSRHELELLLLCELASIERQGQALVGDAGAVSIIRIRKALLSANIWSEQDVSEFDSALRIRNIVAHGDSACVELKDLVDAHATMHRLRRGLGHAAIERVVSARAVTIENSPETQ
jgi:hypothetical protein